MIADETYDEFLNQFVARMRALKLGDPMEETTEIGPLATEQILQGVHDHVQKTIAAGAKLLTGTMFCTGRSSVSHGSELIKVTLRRSPILPSTAVPKSNWV